MSEHVNDCDCCQRKLAALRIAGTIDGIHLRQRDAYRDVLRDLIAELRDEHRMDNGGYCEACDVEPFPCASGRAVNWAEARLREVTGDE